MTNLVKFWGAALAVAMTFYAVGNLFAHHFELAALDPKTQIKHVDGYENMIPRNWMVGSSVKWRVVAPDNRKSHYTSLVTSAIDEWADVISDLEWTQTQGDDWNVTLL